jgi:hypothetical protein
MSKIYLSKCPRTASHVAMLRFKEPDRLFSAHTK